MPVLQEVLKGLQKIRWPNLSAAADDVLEFGARQFMTSPPQEIRAFRNMTPTEDVYKWLREDLPKTGKTIKGAFHEFLSPDIPLGRSEPGKQIYDGLQKADLEMSFRLARDLELHEKLAKKVTQEGSTRMFEAVEDPSKFAALNKHEQASVLQGKKVMDTLWKDYIKQTAGSEEDFEKVMRWSKDKLDLKQLDSLPENLQEAYKLARSTLKDYVPHTWKREDLLGMLENSRMQNVLKFQNATTPSIKNHYKDVIKEYDESLRKLNGGDPLAFDNIPKEILFRHGLLRKGALGYEKDFVRSVRSYVYHINKKMIEEPALKQAAELYGQLPFEQRPYAKWFLRDWAGLNAKSPLDAIAGKISSFEYMRTLGLNPRSALTNLSQQINTWADAGPVWSAKGYIRALSAEGKELWDKSKLAIQVPSVFTDELHPGAGHIERLKRISGTLFNWAETANRKHAFLTYLSKYENKYGAGSPQAFDESIKGVYKTQFAYGRVGMPKILRTAPGRVIGQFSSFSIKQGEFLGRQLKEIPKDIKAIGKAIFSGEFDKRRGEELWRIAKENPMKFIQWAAMAEGGKYTLGEVLGIDMSNAFGFGLSFGEGLDAFRSMTKGEFDEMWTHGQLAFAQGSGILPSGPGPAITGLKAVYDAYKKGESPASALVKELTPVQWQRVEDLLVSLKNRTAEGDMPFGKVEGMPFGKELTDVAGTQSLPRAFSEMLAKSKERTGISSEQFKQSRMDILESKRKRLIAEMIASGKQEQAQNLIEKYGVVPTREALHEAILRRTLPKNMRPKNIKAAERQRIRDLRKEVEEEE